MAHFSNSFSVSVLDESQSVNPDLHQGPFVSEFKWVVKSDILVNPSIRIRIKAHSSPNLAGINIFWSADK